MKLARKFVLGLVLASVSSFAVPLHHVMRDRVLCHFYWQAESGHTYELHMGHTPDARSMTNVLYRLVSCSHQHGEFDYVFSGTNQFFRLMDTVTACQ